jgi:Zn-finger nucleic acid-binding protein
MRTVDRHGIRIEQCERCRGVFLDAGELEQIAAAERRYYDDPPPYQAPADSHVARPGAGGRGYSDSPPPYGGRRYADSPKPFGGTYRDSPPAYGRRRKRSFLEGLFD